MKLASSNLFFSSLVLFLTPLSADVIKLTDGTEYIGRVIKENAESYEIEVQYSDNIKDRRTIKRDELLSVTKEEVTHEEELKVVLRLIPTANQLTEEDYDSLLKNKIEPLFKLPLSKEESLQAKRVEGLIRAEKSRTVSGDLKVDGKWLSYQERQANLYAIDSKTALMSLSERAKAKIAVPTLIEFEKFEKEFGESEHFKMALEIALDSIKSYEPVILESLDTYEERLANREANMLVLSFRDARRAKEEATQLHTKALANAEEAKALNKKWFQSYAFEKAGLKAIAQTLKSEKTRLLQALDKIDAKDDESAESLYRLTYEVIATGDIAEGEKHFSKVKSRKLPPKYTTILESQLDLKKQIVENQKAEELAKLESEKAKKEAEEKEAVDGEEEPAGTPEKEAESKSSPSVPEKVEAETEAVSNS